jgi:excisionase family DNA binding protein
MRHPPDANLSTALRCPGCGREIFRVDLPTSMLPVDPAGEHGAPTRLLSVTEASRELSISRSALYGLLARGELKALHVGRRTLIPRTALDAFIRDGLR